ncbi:hypothetical protein CgunFtcFv8_009485 [Champsocephalus gunnari]|uniref:Uncharacterized protein n=1 Tax=Champsocephalus gunnari TaxID=52237 RepID=A0AAN8C657_CHAGU|nr:hypothetical protein CgunFtcFv8_009485 [Champsocephalus gunnari]
MGRVRQIDPWSKGQCVNSSITGDTSQADAQQSAERLIHLSLQLPEAQSQRQSQATAGSRRADPPRTHPSFMGCNPRPEWVTGARGAARAGGQWSLMCVYMCGFPFPLECTGVELSASLCQTLKAFQWPGEKLEGSVGSGHLFIFVSQLHLVRTCCI